jgi:hypothetical protein
MARISTKVRAIVGAATAANIVIWIESIGKLRSSCGCCIQSEESLKEAGAVSGDQAEIQDRERTHKNQTAESMTIRIDRRSLALLNLRLTV